MMLQGIFSHGQDPNEWWALWGFGALLVTIRTWRDARRERARGRSVPAFLGAPSATIFGASFVALAIYEILTHPGAWGTR